MRSEMFSASHIPGQIYMKDMYLLRKPSITCFYEMHMLYVVLSMCINDLHQEELLCILLLCVADIFEKRILLPYNMNEDCQVWSCNGKPVDISV